MKKRAGRTPPRRNGVPIWNLTAAGALTTFLVEHAEAKAALEKGVRAEMDRIVEGMHRDNQRPREAPSMPKLKRGAKALPLPPPKPHAVVPVTDEGVVQAFWRDGGAALPLKAMQAGRGRNEPTLREFIDEWIEEVCRGRSGSVNATMVRSSLEVTDEAIEGSFLLMGEDFGDNEEGVEVPAASSIEDDAIDRHLIRSGASILSRHHAMRTVRIGRRGPYGQDETTAWTYKYHCRWPINASDIVRRVVGEVAIWRFAVAAVNDPRNDPSR